MLNYNKIIDNEKFITAIGQLYWRWLDEQMYESPASYKDALVSLIKEYNGEDIDITNVKFCKRPFGIKFNTPCDNKVWQLSVTMRTIGLQRIG